MARKSGSSPVLRSVVVFFGKKEYTFPLSKGENLQNHRMVKQILNQLRSEHVSEVEGVSIRRQEVQQTNSAAKVEHAVRDSAPGTIWDDFFHSDEHALITDAQKNMFAEDIFSCELW